MRIAIFLVIICASFTGYTQQTYKRDTIKIKNLQKEDLLAFKNSTTLLIPLTQEYLCQALSLHDCNNMHRRGARMVAKSLKDNQKIYESYKYSSKIIKESDLENGLYNDIRNYRYILMPASSYFRINSISVGSGMSHTTTIIPWLLVDREKGIIYRVRNKGMGAKGNYNVVHAKITIAKLNRNIKKLEKE